MWPISWCEVTKFLWFTVVHCLMRKSFPLQKSCFDYKNKKKTLLEMICMQKCSNIDANNWLKHKNTYPCTRMANNEFFLWLFNDWFAGVAHIVGLKAKALIKTVRFFEYFESRVIVTLQRWRYVKITGIFIWLYSVVQIYPRLSPHVPQKMSRDIFVVTIDSIT